MALTVDLDPHGRVDLQNSAHTAVHPALRLAADVVAQEHHPRAHLEFERLVGRVRAPTELAVDLGPRGEHPTGQAGELGGVDARDGAVRGGQGDRAIRRGGSGAHLVEATRDLGGHVSVPHRVEHALELVLVLAMDGRQLVDREVGLVPDLRVEEPHRVVPVGEVGALVALPRHWGELVRVAEQHHLHPAECLVLALAGLPQRPVDRIEQVGVDHRHLVDHEGVDRVEELLEFRALVDVVVGNDADRQTEQRVDGLPAHVESGHAGRSADHELLRGVPRQVVEEGRLAGAGTAGDEDVVASGLDAVVDGLLLRGQAHLAHGFTVPAAMVGSRQARPPVHSPASVHRAGGSRQARPPVCNLG